MENADPAPRPATSSISARSLRASRVALHPHSDVRRRSVRRTGRRASAGWLALAPGIVFPLEIAVAGFMPSRSMVGTVLCAVVITICALRLKTGTSALLSRDAGSV